MQKRFDLTSKEDHLQLMYNRTKKKKNMYI